MKPRISGLTLGADDLERAVAFYVNRHLWEIVWNPALPVA
jgi:hypothetical protein